MFTDQLNQYIADLKSKGLYRRRQLTSGSVVNFSSNDYLSLTTEPQIKRAYQLGFKRYPSGSGGSMLVCGYHSIHKTLEKEFAAALSVDDCLLFSSGYAANLSIIGLLTRLNSHILIDKMVHASIYDGLTAFDVKYSRYLHNDLSDLALKIQDATPNKVLVTEGLFSMSGQCAPLSSIAQLCNFDLIIDEAHSFGLLGHQGLGAVVQHQLTQNEVPLRVIPFGKAFAASGAIVAGRREWIDALLQSARPYIYSTAVSPALAYGFLKTLEVIRAADERRTKLRSLVNYFRDAVARSSLTWRDSVSPIQQLHLGCPERALYYAQGLQEQSIVCLAIRQPTVSKQETGLRVILNYLHEPEQIDYLFKCLHQL